MNRTYRGVDATTDILSFPADLPPDLPDEIAEELGIDADGDLNPPYLGDLVIAYSYTARQAQQSGHALHDEMRLLVIHGTLHLLGYDHDTAEREAEMWATQNEALRQLDILIRVPRFFPDVSSDSITDYPNGN
jgi:probable rRNA maturation factor